MGMSSLLVSSVFVIKGGAGVLFNNTNYNRRFFEAPGIIIWSSPRQTPYRLLGPESMYKVCRWALCSGAPGEYVLRFALQPKQLWPNIALLNLFNGKNMKFKRCVPLELGHVFLIKPTGEGFRDAIYSTKTGARKTTSDWHWNGNNNH